MARWELGFERGGFFFIQGGIVFNEGDLGDCLQK